MATAEVKKKKLLVCGITCADPVLCWVRPELFMECESGTKVGVESALGFIVCVCQEEAELTCYHFLQSGSA